MIGVAINQWKPDRAVGGGALISLDFGSMATLPSFITFTRATTATMFNDSLVLASVASGAARLGRWSPSGIRGLLVEGSRTNLLLYSEDFRNTADAGSARPWVYTDCSLTPNAAVAPDGATTADKIIRTSGTGIRGVRQSYAATSGQSGTFSFYAKAAEYGFVGIVLYNSQGRATVNLSTLATATYGPATTVTATSVGNGWVRCSITRTWDVTGDVSPGITVQNSIDDPALCPSQGDGTSGIYIWGAQLEAGTFPSTYIPTTSGTFSRAAELPLISAASLTSLIGAAAVTALNATGSMMIEYSFEGGASTLLGGSRAGLWFQNAGVTEQQLISSSDTGGAVGYMRGRTTGGGVTTTINVAPSSAAGVMRRVLYTWKTDDCQTWADGAHGVRDTSGNTMPTLCDRISIGCSAVSTAHLFGVIRRIWIWSHHIATDAEGDGLTA